MTTQQRILDHALSIILGASRVIEHTKRRCIRHEHQAVQVLIPLDKAIWELVDTLDKESR